MVPEEPLGLGNQDFCRGAIQEELEFSFSKASVVHRVGGEGVGQGSPSLGRGPVLVHGLLGTGQDHRRGAAGKQSFIGISSHSLSLTLPAELCQLSDQQRIRSLV